jgi:phospholipid/cholesterol/gamma-HCH transport system substrate-binding protein
MALVRKRPSRERRRMSPFTAGVVAIVLIAIPCYLAFGGSVPWKQEHIVKAIVRSGNELQARSPVRIAGVEVGRVKSIARGPGSTAIVPMVVNKEGLPIRGRARRRRRRCRRAARSRSRRPPCRCSSTRCWTRFG